MDFGEEFGVEIEAHSPNPFFARPVNGTLFFNIYGDLYVIFKGLDMPCIVGAFKSTVEPQNQVLGLDIDNSI